jgi:hypothetical protein
MEWHKIIFDADQITGDVYDRLKDQIRDTIFQDSLKYRDVAICSARADFITKHNTLSTITKYFTPDAVKYFWHLLEPYSPAPCAKPPREEVSAELAVDSQVESRLWA